MTGPGGLKLVPIHQEGDQAGNDVIVDGLYGAVIAGVTIPKSETYSQLYVAEYNMTDLLGNGTAPALFPTSPR